jgi:DNA-binding PadR family transcriptional regulator
MLTRLIVLWLLQERSLYGYEVKKALAERAFGFWFPIEPASIYVVLKTLVRRGHARVVRTEREGNRPHRTRYAITRSGRETYRALLRRAWVELPPIGTPFHLALAARADLDESEITELLEARAERLRDRRSRMTAFRSAAPESTLVTHAEAMLSAESRWLESRLRDERGSRSKPGKDKTP